jgi:hypothetical protein
LYKDAHAAWITRLAARAHPREATGQDNSDESMGGPALRCIHIRRSIGANPARRFALRAGGGWGGLGLCMCQGDCARVSPGGGRGRACGRCVRVCVHAEAHAWCGPHTGRHDTCDAARRNRGAGRVCVCVCACLVGVGGVPLGVCVGRTYMAPPVVVVDIFSHQRSEWRHRGSTGAARVIVIIMLKLSTTAAIIIAHGQQAQSL